MSSWSPLHGLDGLQDIAPFPQVLFPDLEAGQVGQDGQNAPVIQWHPNVGPAAHGTLRLFSEAVLWGPCSTGPCLGHIL